MLQRTIIVGLILLTVVGCSALGSEDIPGTVAVESTAYAAEATAMALDLQAQGTAVYATAVFAETYVTQMDGINRQMVATLRAAVPPTQQIVQERDASQPLISGLEGVPQENLPGNADASSGAGAGAGAGASGITEFQPVQTASSVRASDGCADVVTNEFTVDSSTIYATVRAFNMRAGTDMRVEWLFGGQVVYSWQFVVDVDDADYCLWFSMTPQDAPFTPGDWSVQMLANGAPLPAPASFRIVEAM
ncbi:MAG: hypothetical protein IH587_06770 [Anaerolineae bacterium]|nr:hypothetical protein [Anaerolineae bacterium]